MLQDYARRFWGRLRMMWERRWFRIMAYAFGGMVFFAILMDSVVMPFYTKHGQAITLPDVTKTMVDDARATMTANGFRLIEAEQRFDSQTPSGYIIEQSPRGGTLVKSGRRVYVIVSQGERKFSMPNLVDMSERDARLNLAKHGLQIGEKTYEPSDYYPEGVVMHQSIPPEVEAARGTRVDLTISRGPASDEVVVPLVEGRPLASAREELARKGVEIGTISYQPSSKLLPETVVKQSILPGTKISREERVDLVVSTLSRN